jgi:predicted Zn-dependent protease
MNRHRVLFISGILAVSLVLLQCKDDPSINFFTVGQDIDFGASMDTTILESPDLYPILSETTYAQAYQHINRIRDNVLASGELKYGDRFPWQIRIIHNDTTLNAFAAPGGYMYFYTGIIHFLDNEAQFAGVMAHEMAHCDRRHSTDNLTKQYGISIMLAMLLGNEPGQLAQIAAGLASGLSSLAFSRQNEYEADEYAVRYLVKTDYDARGLSGFFEKMEGRPTPPVFLSTHPSPEDRLEQIQYHWEQQGSIVGELAESSYSSFKNSLPAPTP